MGINFTKPLGDDPSSAPDSASTSGPPTEVAIPASSTPLPPQTNLILTPLPATPPVPSTPTRNRIHFAPPPEDYNTRPPIALSPTYIPRVRPTESPQNIPDEAIPSISLPPSPYSSPLTNRNRSRRPTIGYATRTQTRVHSLTPAENPTPPITPPPPHRNSHNSRLVLAIGSPVFAPTSIFTSPIRTLRSTPRSPSPDVSFWMNLRSGPRNQPGSADEDDEEDYVDDDDGDEEEDDRDLQSIQDEHAYIQRALDVIGSYSHSDHIDPD